MGALGRVGRGFGSAGRAELWWGLGFGRAGRAGLVGQGCCECILTKLIYLHCLGSMLVSLWFGIAGNHGR